jgi:hypothetical protein
VVRSRSQKRLVLGRLARKRQLLHSLEPSGAQGKKASARCRLRDCAASYHAIVRDRLPPSFAGDKGGEVTIYKRQRSRECLRRANVWPMNYFRSVDLDQGSLARALQLLLLMFAASSRLVPANAGSIRPSCCASTTLSIFCWDQRPRPISARGGEDTRLCSWPWGNCMGETLLLLSCGAAFITGLVIAAVSLFS